MLFRAEHLTGSAVRVSAVKITKLWVATCICSLTLAAQNPPANPKCKGPAPLEQAVASHPTAAAYDALGAYFGQHNRFPCAFAAFESAIRLEPNSWEAHFNLGLALLGNGDAARATREFRSAVRLKPGPQTHAALGLALSQSNQAQAAAEEFKTALKADP